MEGHTSRRVWLGRLGALAAVVVGAGLGFLAWQHYYPVRDAADWQHRVLIDRLPVVSALAADGRGGVFVSLELKHGKGRILQIGSDGSRRTVKDGLSKLDGMIGYRGGVAYSQEEGDEPVRWWQGDRDEALFVGRDVEELATDGHFLYAIEDRPQHARLLRFDPDKGEVRVLRTDLEVAEGVAVCPDGRVFYLEKKRGWVKQLQDDGNDSIVAQGLNEPGFLMCDGAGLWITEDATHLARLLLIDAAGRLQTILSHLRSAQTILPFGENRYLLAEQGRDRILEITR